MNNFNYLDSEFVTDNKCLSTSIVNDPKVTHYDDFNYMSYLDIDLY